MLIIPGYTIIKQIGQGGMATIHYAVQKSANRPVALKILSSHLLADPMFGKRFLREARISGQLDHPQIVTVYDVNQYEACYYICMEYFSGGDLKQKIDTSEITVDDAVQFTLSLAETLHYAHEKGFVHRDIKPANIMFRNNSLPVITDFGIARTMTSLTRMTTTGSVLGTPMYMSPEQTQGKEVDGRSDLYSLAIVFFEMLTDRCPFEADSAIAVGVKQLSEAIPQLDPPFDIFQDFFNKALAKSPEDRFARGQTFAETLAAINYQQPETLDATRIDFSRRPAEPEKKSHHSNQARNLILLSLTILAIGGGVWWQQQTTTIDNSPPQQVRNELPVSTADSLAIRLSNLLTEAQQFERQDALIEPAEDNALATYLTILTLDADYQPAINGLATLAKQLNLRIDNEVENENLIKADKLVGQLAMADESLAADAKKRINIKKDQLQKQRDAEVARQKLLEEKQRNQQRIARALLAVDAVLEKPKTSLQQLKTAKDSLQKILASEPGHLATRKKLLRVSDAAISLVNTELAAQPASTQQLEKAEHTLAFIATMLPSDNQQLRLLQKRHLDISQELENRRQQKEKRRVEIANAINQAKRLLESTTLTLFDIEEAQKSLAIAREKDSASTLNYDVKLADAYIQLTEKLLNEKQFESAEESVNAGLDVFANNSELTILALEIKTIKKRQLRALPAF